MYGFVDYDLLFSRKKLPTPNLEIMKLMAYYQEEENQLCKLIIDLSEEDLSFYEKIIIRSDNSNPEDVFKNLPLLPSMEIGGKTFSKKYLPLEKELMEYMIPDSSVYQEWVDRRIASGKITEMEGKAFLETPYYRMYLGAKRLPPPVIKRRRTMIIYDEDFLLHDDWKESLEILSERVSKIYFINNLICKKMSDLVFLKNNKKIKSDCSLILDFYIPEEDIQYFIKKYKRILQDKSRSSPYYFFICKNYACDYYGETFYARNFRYSMKLITALWYNHIPASLLIWKNLDPKVVNEYNELFIHLSNWSRRTFEKKERGSAILLEKKLNNQKLIDQMKNFLKKYPSYTPMFLLSVNGIWGGLQDYVE